MFTNAEIIFYDENGNSNIFVLTNAQIYAIKKILGLDYDYDEECFLCYDDKGVIDLTNALFSKWKKSRID